MGDGDGDERRERAGAVACRFYTHARRYPLVIGNIQGLRIPPVTPAQLGIGIGSLIVLLAARPLWAHFGWVGNGLVVVAVPVGLAWAARAVRMEGRAPWRAGLGWLQLLAAPAAGVRLGRPDRDRREHLCRSRSWLVEFDDAGSGR